MGSQQNTCFYHYSPEVRNLQEVTSCLNLGSWTEFRSIAIWKEYSVIYQCWGGYDISRLVLLTEWNHLGLHVILLTMHFTMLCHLKTGYWPRNSHHFQFNSIECHWQLISLCIENIMYYCLTLMQIIITCWNNFLLFLLLMYHYYYMY